MDRYKLFKDLKIYSGNGDFNSCVQEFITTTWRTTDLFPLFPYFRDHVFMRLIFRQLIVHSSASTPELTDLQEYLINLSHTDSNLYMLSL